MLIITAVIIKENLNSHFRGENSQPIASHSEKILILMDYKILLYAKQPSKRLNEVQSNTQICQYIHEYQLMKPVLLQRTNNTTALKSYPVIIHYYFGNDQSTTLQMLKSICTYQSTCHPRKFWQNNVTIQCKTMLTAL